MNKSLMLLIIFFASLWGYCIWEGKKFYTETETPPKEITEEECTGEWIYLEGWDKYGNDLGGFTCFKDE